MPSNKNVLLHDEAVALKFLGFKEPTIQAYDRIGMLCTHGNSVFNPLN
jgi:hypothetical protein